MTCGSVSQYHELCGRVEKKTNSLLTRILWRRVYMQTGFPGVFSSNRHVFQSTYYRVENCWGPRNFLLPKFLLWCLCLVCCFPNPGGGGMPFSGLKIFYSL